MSEKSSTVPMRRMLTPGNASPTRYMSEPQVPAPLSQLILDGRAGKGLLRTAKEVGHRLTATDRLLLTPRLQLVSTPQMLEVGVANGKIAGEHRRRDFMAVVAMAYERPNEPFTLDGL